MAGTILEGKDLLGKDLSIGDKVAFTIYGSETIRIGTIDRETLKRVYVQLGSLYYRARLSKWKGNSNRIIKI